MKGMDSFRKNLHLTRQEAGMVFILVVLLSGLMFSVGLWVGFSFSGDHAEIASHETSSHDGQGEAAGPGRAPASTGGEHKKVAKKAVPAGDELRKAFHESKQTALAEVVVESATLTSPKSILDAKAHQGVHTEWDRKPSSIEADPVEVEAHDKLLEQEEARKKAGISPKVSNLFERSPDSIKDFDPTPGSYTLQLASFATLDESGAMVKDLRKAGFLDAYTQEIKFKNGEMWHRVAMGSYPNPVFARKMGERLRRRSLAKDFIVRKVAD